MKVLITNNTLSWIGGTETATFALAEELKRQGDDVTAFSSSLGIVSDKLDHDGIRCLDNLKDNKFDIVLKPKKDLEFDVGHIHHNTTIGEVTKNLPSLPLVFTCHGLIWEMDGRICPEKPPFGTAQIKEYVGVSEEVCAAIAGAGYESTIIRNGVDTDRFKPNKPLNKKLKKILVITNWWGNNSAPAKILEEAIKGMPEEIEVMALGYNWEHQWDIERAINSADLVIAYGRGCLEAMACGRPVLVFGHNGADGIVTEENYEEIRKCNFSGRRFAELWTPERLREELLKYNPEMGKVARRLVMKNHNIKDTVKQYKEVYARAIQK